MNLRWTLRAALEALVVVAVFAAVGAAVGYGWFRLWDSPSGVAFEGEWYPVPSDEGYRSIFGATASYVLLGALAGLVLGVLAAMLARHSELVTLAAVVVGTALAAWLSYRIGSSLGPPDAAALAASAKDYDEIPGNLAIEGRSPFVAWTFGGLLGVASTYLLTSGLAESRRRERHDPSWLTRNPDGRATSNRPEHPCRPRRAPPRRPTHDEQPPAGPVPAPDQPGASQPEILASGYGSAVGPARRRRSGARKGLAAGAALVLVAGLGVGGYAAWSAFFATGPQPAEALPASTVGYLSVDLDPAGRQKLEARETLGKFPALDGRIDTDSEGSLRESLFEQLQEAGACPDLDWGDDVDPWLGDRFAVAAVDLGEQDDESPSGVTPVLVVQVTDADLADEGLGAVVECAESDTVGWSIRGGWAVIAETAELAESVTDAAADAPLSDDADFQRWTGAAGDHGVLTAYASPEAGAPAGRGGRRLRPRPARCASRPTAPTPGSTPRSATTTGDTDPSPGRSWRATSRTSRARASRCGSPTAASRSSPPPPSTCSPPPATARSRSPRAATTSSARCPTTPPPRSASASSRAGSRRCSTPTPRSPATRSTSTSCWRWPRRRPASTSPTTSRRCSASPPRWRSVPTSTPTPRTPPTSTSAVKIQGDPDRIAEVLDELRDHPEVADDLGELLDYDIEGNHVVVGPSSGYREQVLDQGNLGQSDKYEDVVPESGRAGTVLYVDVDAFDDLLEAEAGGEGGDDELVENLEVLAAVGYSTWTDDDVAHAMLKVTTDD